MRSSLFAALLLQGLAMKRQRSGEPKGPKGSESDPESVSSPSASASGEPKPKGSEFEAQIIRICSNSLQLSQSPKAKERKGERACGVSWERKSV